MTITERELRFPLSNKSIDKLKEAFDANDAVADKVMPLTLPAAVSSGAIDPANPIAFVSITGTVGFTLADGTSEGQRIRIVVIEVGASPVATLTPATFNDGTSLSGMDSLGSFLELQWHSVGGWYLVGSEAALVIT